MGGRRRTFSRAKAVGPLQCHSRSQSKLVPEKPLLLLTADTLRHAQSLSILFLFTRVTSSRSRAPRLSHITIHTARSLYFFRITEVGGCKVCFQLLAGGRAMGRLGSAMGERIGRSFVATSGPTVPLGGDWRGCSAPADTETAMANSQPLSFTRIAK